MKKFLQYSLLTLFSICFLFFVLEFVPLKTDLKQTDVSESYDTSLSYLTSKKQLFGYCDSVFNAKADKNNGGNLDSIYADIAALVIRERFYHGHAEYGIGNNFMALVLQPLLINKSVTPIVQVEDILKSQTALCGQQAMVLAAVLSRKNIPVRKVVFNHPVHGGHVAIEAFYNNDWHFFDVNRELNIGYTRLYNRPSVAFLMNNQPILEQLYIHYNPSAMVELFTTAKTENFRKVEGPNLLFYHKFTKFLSYTLWLVFLALFLFVKFRVKPINTALSV